MVAKPANLTFEQAAAIPTAAVRSLGADHVVDYPREDFTRSERWYDLLLDVAGSRSWSDCRRVLGRNATLVLVGGPKTSPWFGPLGHVAGVRLASLRASQKVVFFVAKFNREDLTGRCGSLLEAPRPGYLGKGHARAKVVITC